MLLRKRTFRSGDDLCWNSGKLEDWCGDFEIWIRRHFELPRQISRVIISLYSRPSVNRKKGKVEKYCCGLGCCEGGKLIFDRTVFCDEDLSLILRPLTGRTIYLGVEYE